MIRFEEVSLTYHSDQPVLREINLQIDGGKFITLLGPSGCGKSSLLRLAAGLIDPSCGTVTIDQISPAEYRRKHNGVAFVFQDPRLLPWRNVEQNIALPLELQAADRSAVKPLIDSSIGLIGLQAADALKYPRMLSGGMRMRVALARALVTEPHVLLLDEPFAALDDLLRKQLNIELLRVWSERQTTTVFVTHNVSEAIFLSQHVVVMSHQPGHIKEVINVPFAYPRSSDLTATAEFAALTGQVADALQRTGS